jgi:hypothetical protein
VSHAPVDVEFTDAADLRTQLDRFSQTDKWGLVVATKQDLGMRTILHQLGLLINSKNLFIGQYDKLFEEYWLSPISYLSPYRG